MASNPQITRRAKGESRNWKYVSNYTTTSRCENKLHYYYRKSVAPFVPAHLSVPVPGVVAGDLSGVNVPLVLLAAADTLVHPLQVRLVRGVDRAEEMEVIAAAVRCQNLVL